MNIHIVHGMYLTFTYGDRIKSHLEWINVQVFLLIWRHCVRSEHRESKLNRDKVHSKAYLASHCCGNEFCLNESSLTDRIWLDNRVLRSNHFRLFTIEKIFVRSLLFSKHMYGDVMNSTIPKGPVRQTRQILNAALTYGLQTEWIKCNIFGGRTRNLNDSLFMLVKAIIITIIIIKSEDGHGKNNQFIWPFCLLWGWLICI